jgi:hypothetical protein
MMAIILWAHRQRLSESQTHKAPAAAVACCRGTAAISPQSTRRGQALPPDLRRTRPTLTKITLPDRLQPKLPLLPALPLCRPYGVNTLPAGGQGRRQRRQERHQPKSLHSFAPPSSPKNKMRPAMPAPRQKAATLRQARCFGCGQQGTQRKGSAATAVYIFSGMPLPRCLTFPSALLPVPKALRPPLHLSKRMAGRLGALPQMRDSVRPLCV